MNRDEEIYDLLYSIRLLYAEWMEDAKEKGNNPETIVSLVLAKKYYELLDKIKVLEKC